MTGSLMADAFGHRAWATLRLIDVCLTLSPEQLETAVLGTYGSILSTVRHFVGGDAFYRSALTGDRSLLFDEDRLGLVELRAAMERQADLWSGILTESLDADALVGGVDDDGYRRQATVGVRLAQALHHGTDHRSQICTALTTLGVIPPNIDVWDYALETGRSMEVWPTS
jgi:uncharacterized damage-inducible protein DinB